jgi:hypothetical protein
MQLLTVFFVAASVPGRFWRCLTILFYIVYFAGLLYCVTFLFELADKSYHINDDLPEDHLSLPIESMFLFVIYLICVIVVQLITGLVIFQFVAIVICCCYVACFGDPLRGLRVG